MTDFQITVDGQWVTSFARWGGLEWETLADGGCGEAQFDLHVPRTWHHPALRRGRVVQIWQAATPIHHSLLSEWEDDGTGVRTYHTVPTWTQGGAGSPRRGFAALDAAGNVTTDPDVGILQAIARGAKWSHPNLLGTGPLALGGEAPNLWLGDLLDAVAASIGKRWGINADGQVYFAADPTTPMWHIAPGLATVGLASEDYASSVRIRYQTGAATYATAVSTDATAAEEFLPTEALGDATGYGVIAGTTAQAIADTIMATGLPKLVPTVPTQPNRYQITRGGVPADLTMVRGGQMVRMFDVVDDAGAPLPSTDQIIGRTRYVAATDELTIEPVDLAHRTSMSDMLADLGGAA